MILIADSGATKTDWCFGTTLCHSQIIQTEGINPFHQATDNINQILRNGLLPQLPCSSSDIQALFFYGAGCTPEKASQLTSLLTQTFPHATIEVHSDLMGAARALCQHQPGIACILGTGANSCLYDGVKIIQNIPPLGYILGDEGSGAYLGKRFLGDCIKQQLPAELLEGLLKEYQLTLSDILEKVYRQPMANRFLASLTPYIYKHKQQQKVHLFLTNCFTDFFQRNVLVYPGCHQVPIAFTGSVAWYFRQEIEEAAQALNLQTGIFIQSPIQKLKYFHLVKKAL